MMSVYTKLSQRVCLVFGLFVLTAAIPSSFPLTLTARFSYGGIKATLTFKQNGPGKNVKVIKDGAIFEGNMAVRWQVNTFPLEYDVDDRCNNVSLGPSLHVEGSTNDVLELSGQNSIEGRSVSLLNTDNETISCATIQRSGSYVTARAIFRHKILGSVILRQDENSDMAPTRLVADLYFKGLRKSPLTLEWRIVSKDGCSTMSPPYNPKYVVVKNCSESFQTSCAVGDLTGKLGKITVGPKKGTERWTGVDLNLPLSGPNTVLDQTLQIFAPDEAKPRACATITSFVQRTAEAVFDQSGVTGSITLTQPSPFDPTVSHVALRNLRSLAVAYHVHEWPVPQRVGSDQSVCSGASVSGHFNPFGVDPKHSPAPGNGTEDQYQIGDLTGKYGYLMGLDQINETFIDYNLPLFGLHSVMGRSIVIHRTDRSLWICSTLRDISSPVSYALATFKFPVIGFALFQQRLTDGQDTSVYLQLDYADGSTNITKGHSLRVHKNPVSSDWLNTEETTRCLSAGIVFNPFSAVLKDDSEQCNSLNPKLCRLGDLPSKHGTVSVRSVGGPARAFFTDTDLTLEGEDSVIGRPLVLSGADGGFVNLACANIEKLHPRQAEAIIETGTENLGSVTFSQNTWVIQEPTAIRIDVELLNKQVLDYAITTTPKSFKEAHSCGNLGDIYNPFNVTVSSAGGTKDEMKVGDLSGKFGPLSGPKVFRQDLDPTLDLMGPLSVVGRPLVIRSGEGNAACGVIRDKGVPKGMLVSALATFTGDVLGQIRLRQYIYPDGTMSHTSVIVDVRKARGPQTKDHHWHVHVTPVGDDVTTTSGRCHSTGGHYNPYMVNHKNYQECHAGNPLRCELGDLSRKEGQIDMGSDVTLGTDVNLPLVGPFTVVGRSIVIHRENSAYPKIACADIIPDPHTAIFHDTNITAPQVVNRFIIAEAFSTVLQTPRYNILVYVLNSGPQPNCIEIRVYFLGLDGAGLKRKFIRLGKVDPAVFGIYRPCDD